MVAIPHYENYSTPDLYQALNSIRPELYPEILAQLEKELDSRRFLSADEAEECYLLLDKEAWPERSAALCKQLKKMGSPVGQECSDKMSGIWAYIRRFFGG